MVHLKYFASARERVGHADESLALAAGTRVQALMDLLADLHPELKALMPHLRVAVNQEFATPDEVVPDGAEVALIPPVSGGSAPVHRVQGTPLELAQVVADVSAPRLGGLVTFSGAVRDQSQGKRVLRLEYEAYQPMALKKMAEISAEAEARWPGTRVAIHHRVGVLLPGELAVVIAAAAPHRKEAFLACEHAIDRLKHDAPIWKREVYEDGSVWVGLGP